MAFCVVLPLYENLIHNMFVFILVQLSSKAIRSQDGEVVQLSPLDERVVASDKVSEVLFVCFCLIV